MRENRDTCFDALLTGLGLLLMAVLLVMAIVLSDMYF